MINYVWRVPCKRGSSKEVSLDAIKTSNFSPSVLFGDWFVGTYAIVKIRGAKLIGTDKTCHSKFPCSKQEKNVFIDNIYHSEPYTTRIKRVTPTELQQCGVACSPLSPPQRPLCIVGGEGCPPALYIFRLLLFLLGYPAGACGEGRGLWHKTAVLVFLFRMFLDAVVVV